MDRYLIETPHTTSECLNLIGLLNAQGYLRTMAQEPSKISRKGWSSEVY